MQIAYRLCFLRALTSNTKSDLHVTCAGICIAQLSLVSSTNMFDAIKFGEKYNSNRH